MFKLNKRTKCLRLTANQREWNRAQAFRRTQKPVRYRYSIIIRVFSRRISLSSTSEM